VLGTPLRRGVSRQGLAACVAACRLFEERIQLQLLWVGQRQRVDHWAVGTDRALECLRKPVLAGRAARSEAKRAVGCDAWAW
jgi:hypothetical protein